MHQARLLLRTVTRLGGLAAALALVPGSAASASGRDSGTPGSSGTIDIRVSVAAKVAVRPSTLSGEVITAGRPCLASNGESLRLPVEMLLLEVGPQIPSRTEIDYSVRMARLPVGACGADPAGSAVPMAGRWPADSGLLLIRPQ